MCCCAQSPPLLLYTVSTRRDLSQSKMGAVLPGPAGEALQSLANVADVLDVVTECTWAMLHGMSQGSTDEMCVA